MKPDISVIIPVLDEPGINGLIKDLRAKTAPGQVQLIVVDADGSGSTISHISDPGVVTVLSPKGRAVQQNIGAEQASGRILLFLHADTRLPDRFGQFIVDAVDAGFYGGAFELCLDDPHPLIRMISTIGALRSRITGIPYGDQAIFVTRSLFHRIGGFEDIPLMEDIALMKKIKADKVPFTILKQKARTSARMWHKKGIVFTMIRNPLLAFLYYIGVSPKVLVRLYYG